LKEKIAVYEAAGIPVYFGGTLFEAFIVRGQFDDYRRVLDTFGLRYAEVSDGSISLNHDKKCEYIHELAKQVTVLSEVGSKDAAKIIPPYKWIEQMQTELAAGAWKVIGEAREGGNVGLFRDSGEVRQGLVEEILTQVPEDKIIWEAPQKSQQVWFIKLLGANVNLGNISPSEVIPLETIRLGLRGDTFDHFLGEIKL
jgi:phosphosulfolactate synthase